MNNKISLTIEEISEIHISKLAEMVIKLWPDCNYEEEFHNCLKITKAVDQNIFIAKAGDDYIGFIQLSLRTDYVEGTTSTPVVYIEGLYIDPLHRMEGIAHQLVKKAEAWGFEKNCTEIASDTGLTNTNSIEFHKSIGFKEVNRVVCFSKTIDAVNN